MDVVRAGDAMTVHEAILAHGGRIVYSCTITPAEHRSHCSTCGADDHIATRCNGPGRPPRPTEREQRKDARAEANRIEGERRREAARARVREVIARHGGDDLDETRRILRERAEARRTAADLARYGHYAKAVSEALPVDEDAERRVSKLMQQRPTGHVPRKLTRKS